MIGIQDILLKCITFLPFAVVLCHCAVFVTVYSYVSQFYISASSLANSPLLFCTHHRDPGILSHAHKSHQGQSSKTSRRMRFFSLLMHFFCRFSIVKVSRAEYTYTNHEPAYQLLCHLDDLLIGPHLWSYRLPPPLFPASLRERGEGVINR